MKRIISLLLLIVILTCSFSAMADVPDFSKLTDDELLEAQSLMNAEILKRGILKKVKIPAGHYEVGVDIPAGKYILTTEDDIGMFNQVQILMYDSEYWFENRNTSNKQHRLMNEVFSSAGSCSVDLKDGYILYLVNGSFYIEKFNLSLFE